MYSVVLTISFVEQDGVLYGRLSGTDACYTLHSVRFIKGVEYFLERERG